MILKQTKLTSLTVHKAPSETHCHRRRLQKVEGCLGRPPWHAGRAPAAGGGTLGSARRQPARLRHVRDAPGTWKRAGNSCVYVLVI